MHAHFLAGNGGEWRCTVSNLPFGEAIVYEELSEPLRSRGLAAAVAEIVALIKRYQPAFLVIEEIPVLPEFAVADSVVELVLSKVGVRDVRKLRVTKLRGSSFFGGEHAFRIGAEGLELFPRLTIPEAPIDYELVGARSATGVEALDGMLSEGLWKGSSTLVFGPPGSGRTLLGLHLISKGIEAGEKGLIATMQENPTQLQRIAKGFGWDLEAAIAVSMLKLMYVSPVDVYIEEFVSRVIREALKQGAQRLLIDSVNDLQATSPGEGRFRNFMYSLTQAMAVNGISVFMTHEVGDLFSTTVL